MQALLAQAERVRKGVILEMERSGVGPKRRMSKIRWASAYLIQKAGVLQEAKGQPETDKHSQREGGWDGRGREPWPGTDREPRLSPPDPAVRPAGIFLRLDA